MACCVREIPWAAGIHRPPCERPLRVACADAQIRCASARCRTHRFRRAADMPRAQSRSCVRGIAETAPDAARGAAGDARAVLRLRTRTPCGDECDSALKLYVHTDCAFPV